MARPVALLRLPDFYSSVLIIPFGRECSLGRSSECDLVIDDSSVSRRHASLLVDGAGLRITDLASLNGTYVDGVRVAGAAVAAVESRIRFAGLEFLVAGPRHCEPDSSRATDKPRPPALSAAGNAGSVVLTAAQQRVFTLLVAGLPEKRIASRLDLSPCTVHNHVVAIYRAYRVHSRAELLVLALSGQDALMHGQQSRVGGV